MGQGIWLSASAPTSSTWLTSICGRTLQSRRLSGWLPCDRGQLLHATYDPHNRSLRVSRVHVEMGRSSSNSSANCLANVLATNRRRVLPVAIPLTPPSSLVNAVNLALIKGAWTSSGMRAWAKLDAASNYMSKMSVSSSMIFRCSYVHPPGPGDEPRLAVCKLFMNVTRSNTTGHPAQNDALLRGSLSQLPGTSALHCPERAVGAWRHTGADKTLACSGHFSKLNLFLTCSPGPRRQTERLRLRFTAPIVLHCIFEEVTPLSLCELVEPFQQIFATHPASPNWPMPQEERQQTEEFPSADLGNSVLRSNRVVAGFQWASGVGISL